jgi:hypothetical protein
MKVLMLMFRNLACYPSVRQSIGSIAEPPSPKLRPRIERVSGGFDVTREDGLVSFIPDANVVEAIYDRPARTSDEAREKAEASDRRLDAIAEAAKKRPKK